MFGWSVLLAALPVLAFQGTITLGCEQLAQTFAQHQDLVSSVNSVAGLLVFAGCTCNSAAHRKSSWLITFQACCSRRF